MLVLLLSQGERPELFARQIVCCPCERLSIAIRNRRHTTKAIPSSIFHLRLGEYSRIFTSLRRIIVSYTMLYKSCRRTGNFQGPFYLSLVSKFSNVFNKTIIPLALVGYKKNISNSALRTLLTIYHLIFNARSYNNCEMFQPGFEKNTLYQQIQSKQTLSTSDLNESNFSLGRPLRSCGKH